MLLGGVGVVGGMMVASALFAGFGAASIGSDMGGMDGGGMDPGMDPGMDGGDMGGGFDGGGMFDW